VQTPNNKFIKHIGYVAAEHGRNGWFCVFDRSAATEGWQAGRHQWLVKLMPDGPEKTTRSKSEAIAVAKLSAATTAGWQMWWKASSSPAEATGKMA
jgi:hypothetical protein